MNAEKSNGMRQKLVAIRKIEKTDGRGAAERALIEYIREEASGSYEAFLALARLLLKGQRSEDALRAAQKARALAPREVEPLIITGLIQMRMKQTFAAGEAFAGALQIDRNSTRAMLGAAAVKLAEENYDDALKLCERALDLEPDMDRAHELVARIQMRKGNLPAAIEELKGLVSSNPSNRRALRAYLGLMKNEDRGDEALQFLLDGAKANPDDPRWRRTATAVAARQGNLDVALGPLKERLESGRASAADRVRHVLILIQAGKTDEARAVIDSIEAKGPLKPIVAKLNGDVLLKSGDTAAAQAAYETVCAVVGVAPLSEELAASAETPEALTRLWKGHSGKAVGSALRAFRAERPERRAS